eukprot:scaffold157769_cov14-Tisochrysis_lutea.AAC.1
MEGERRTRPPPLRCHLANRGQHSRLSNGSGADIDSRLSPDNTKHHNIFTALALAAHGTATY